MTPEQPPREALRPLRPLPSIDIPLLREERSALRNRRLARLAIAGSLIAALLGASVYAARIYWPARMSGEAATKSGADHAAPLVPPPLGVPQVVQLNEPGAGSEPQPSEPSASGPTIVDTAPPVRAAGRYERKFGRALSFGDALRSAGLEPREADEVIAALAGSLDFRRAQADDTMIVERDGAAVLQRFEYRSSPTVRYEATRDALGQLAGRPIKLVVETKRVQRGGIVEDSLGDALEGLKLGRALSGVFADVFSRKVNFSSDTRRGDSFRVVLDEERAEHDFLRLGTIYALEYSGQKAGTQRAFWHAASVGGDFYDEQGRGMHGGWLRTPVRYDHVASGFGVRMHPVLKRKLMHSGIDYAAPSGTMVVAAASGTVRFAGPKGANGNLLAIVHANGYETFYAHLSRIAPGIKPGSRVKQKQLVAYVGSTGRSTGPHLHFALKQGGRFIDPNKQLNGPGLPLPARELPAYKQRVRELLGVLAAIPLERPAQVAKAAQPATFEIDEDEEL
jgi:murein DD-endopeptidase MepM/ murein hydrolase activator NlpD